MIKLYLATLQAQTEPINVDKVIVKLKEGNVTFLPGHITVLSIIENGYVKYEDKEINIDSAVVHFSNDELYITYI